MRRSCPRSAIRGSSRASRPRSAECSSPEPPRPPRSRVAANRSSSRESHSRGSKSLGPSWTPETGKGSGRSWLSWRDNFGDNRARFRVGSSCLHRAVWAGKSGGIVRGRARWFGGIILRSQRSQVRILPGAPTFARFASYGWQATRRLVSTVARSADVELTSTHFSRNRDPRRPVHR